jgi:hypothetical protein
MTVATEFSATIISTERLVVGARIRDYADGPRLSSDCDCATIQYIVWFNAFYCSTSVPKASPPSF